MHLNKTHNRFTSIRTKPRFLVNIQLSSPTPTVFEKTAELCCHLYGNIFKNYTEEKNAPKNNLDFYIMRVYYDIPNPIPMKITYFEEDL